MTLIASIRFNDHWSTYHGLPVAKPNVRLIDDAPKHLMWLT